MADPGFDGPTAGEPEGATKAAPAAPETPPAEKKAPGSNRRRAARKGKAPVAAPATKEELLQKQKQLVETFSRLSPSQLVSETARLWSETHNAPTLLMWLGDNDMIDRDVGDKAYRALARLGRRPPVLWVMLTSSGGNLDGAYQFARRLQDVADRVHMVIPRWAKSAATLITLGCHEVVMHPQAELGPLDAQVTIMRKGHRKQMSTLDALKSLEYIRMYTADSFDLLTDLILRRSGHQITLQNAAKMSTAVTRALVRPLFAQVDAIQVGEHYRLLTLSREYGSRLLAESYKAMSPKQRDQLLNKVINEYPAHSFVIDLKEAKALGLNVRQPSPAELAILDVCVSLFGVKTDTIELFDVTSPSAKPSPPSGNIGALPSDNASTKKGAK
ncbi:hypothetical protein [Myxococcus sp. RHSTA-1-4]|uniref:SDH family Clp fold serine proteinase n=1 Tax=Myxococcus sp. RHSTA-1-4 TaxID=2874601 RepID=UPI001CBA6B9D|nr:hypothetical protein [Myxococcus sp. RHSTA-1-4]MBZ4417664.1 hypothetical protein [Myxococcus sp. RHSTA-1-4]